MKTIANSLNKSSGYNSQQFVEKSSNQAFYRFVIRLVSGSALCVTAAIQAQAQTQVAVPDSGSVPASSGNTNSSDLFLLPPPAKELKAFKNEVGATADFMFGQGTVTVPIGYGLAQDGGGLKPEVITPNRSSVYYGGTLSYSFGRAWYLDFSYEKGNSTGSQPLSVPFTQNGPLNTSFIYNDEWYQLYVRYNFQDLLAGTRFKAYLRGGGSIVQATLSVNDTGQSLYRQNDNTTDYLGNLGFGLSYSLYSTVRIKIGLQVEAEGFGGVRSQQISEYLDSDQNFTSASDNINNNLFGGIGRGTVHGEFRMGQSGRWRLTSDVGIQAKYTMITYQGAGSYTEYLWGPYVKVGVSYLF